MGWEQLFAGKPQTYPYKKTEALFTAAERSFLAALEQSVDARYCIFGKVRLADIVQTHSGLSPSLKASAFNRIAKKHVDFVLCEPCTLKVVCVVELDDRTHQLPDRQKRDIREWRARCSRYPDFTRHGTIKLSDWAVTPTDSRRHRVGIVRTKEV